MSREPSTSQGERARRVVETAVGTRTCFSNADLQKRARGKSRASECAEPKNTVITEPEVERKKTLDLRAFERALFDVRLFNPYAPSNLQSLIAKARPTMLAFRLVIIKNGTDFSKNRFMSTQ